MQKYPSKQKHHKYDNVRNYELRYFANCIQNCILFTKLIPITLHATENLK